VRYGNDTRECHDLQRTSCAHMRTGAASTSVIGLCNREAGTRCHLQLDTGHGAAVAEASKVHRTIHHDAKHLRACDKELNDTAEHHNRQQAGCRPLDTRPRRGSTPSPIRIHILHRSHHVRTLAFLGLSASAFLGGIVAIVVDRRADEALIWKMTKMRLERSHWPPAVWVISLRSQWQRKDFKASEFARKSHTAVTTEKSRAPTAGFESPPSTSDGIWNLLKTFFVNVQKRLECACTHPFHEES
jgi:hypothetical protein